MEDNDIIVLSSDSETEENDSENPKRVKRRRNTLSQKPTVEGVAMCSDLIIAEANNEDKTNGVATSASSASSSSQVRVPQQRKRTATPTVVQGNAGYFTTPTKASPKGKDECNKCDKLLEDKIELQGMLKQANETNCEQEELLSKALEDNMTWKNKVDMAEDKVREHQFEIQNLREQLKDAQARIKAKEESLNGVVLGVKKLYGTLTNAVYRNRNPSGNENGEGVGTSVEVVSVSNGGVNEENSVQLEQFGERLKLLATLVQQKCEQWKEHEASVRAELNKTKEILRRLHQKMRSTDRQQQQKARSPQPPFLLPITNDERDEEDPNGELLPNANYTVDTSVDQTSSAIHQRDTTRTDGIFCKCGKKYTKKCYLTEHIFCMTNGKRFQCQICGNRFFVHGKLTRHMLASHNILQKKTYGCKSCGRVFPDMPRLIKHRIISHNYQGRFYTRTIKMERNGGRLPPQQNSRRRKPKSSQARDPLATTTTNTGRRLILRKRVKPARFVDGIDGDELSLGPVSSPINDVNGVDDELNGNSMEEGDDDYHENSYDSNNVTIDNAEHGDAYSPQGFMCLCGTRCSTKKNLRQHILLKQKDKIFKCNFCSCSFARHDYLKNHVMSAHKVPYKAGKWSCRLCAKTFNTMKLLCKHREVVHNIKPTGNTQSKFNITIKSTTSLSSSPTGNSILSVTSASVQKTKVENGPRQSYTDWLANLPSSSPVQRKQVTSGGESKINGEAAVTN